MKYIYITNRPEIAAITQGAGVDRICVDMECSAFQAVCDFRGLELYQFVYTADSLNGSWSRRILGHLEMDARLAYFVLAEKIAERISAG